MIFLKLTVEYHTVSSYLFFIITYYERCFVIISISQISKQTESGSIGPVGSRGRAGFEFRQPNCYIVMPCGVYSVHTHLNSFFVQCVVHLSRPIRSTKITISN